LTQNLFCDREFIEIFEWGNRERQDANPGHHTYALNNKAIEIDIYVKTYSTTVRKHYIMKVYGGAEVNFHAFLTLILVGGEYFASHTDPITHKTSIFY
jgi:hypothetical protein